MPAGCLRYLICRLRGNDIVWVWWLIFFCGDRRGWVSCAEIVGWVVVENRVGAGIGDSGVDGDRFGRYTSSVLELL